MRVILNNIEGKSQYDISVHPNFQNSACGPTTMHVILRYFNIEKNINDLYKQLGTTKIGLFKWRLIKRLRNLVGSHFTISSCSLAEALTQLERGNPVALKFDQYFSLQWHSKKKPLFKYHWVPLIGYEQKKGKLYLIIHDNGGRGRSSQIRTFCYEDNQHVLSFVKIERK
ncbi:C39 family peptidase [Bacillus ndiopicus]|uniref:C39 family peptidase n=1 Tax=Bacillus ndiopicus TaxID=1347368 RepID=UPI0005AB2521|nr:C39 family peptidase [Bacillus ndiopicus]